MRAKYLLQLVMLLVLIPFPTEVKANDFFKERYRGWLWFEERQQPEEEKALSEPKSGKELTLEEMEQAKRENETFAKELELLRHTMIRYPDNLDYVKRYKDKEKEMLENSLKLSRSYIMVNFLNPGLADELENPQNLYGRDIKKELDQEENKQKLMTLAGEVELFIFRKSDCKYCELLEKHLARFAAKYGFKVEAVSNDNSSSPYFKTHFNEELIEALDMQVMPTVIAVTNDSSLRFELARGTVSVADLEEKSLLLFRYLKDIAPNQMPKAKEARRKANE
jgi:thiol-disulfide isomerase/thioredoxin